MVLINFPWGKQLIGWDNLLPEFNLSTNIERAIFGVWQEHQGLGHVGGHGYAATLPHSLAIALLRLIFPVYSVRAILNLSMLLVGSLGASSSPSGIY